MWFFLFLVVFIFLGWTERELLISLAKSLFLVLSKSRTVQNLLAKFLGSGPEGIKSFNREVAEINYEYNGSTHKVFVPFSRRAETKTVILMIGEKKIDITQQRGVPYFVTPKMLGGTVVVWGEDDKKIVDPDDVIRV